MKDYKAVFCDIDGTLLTDDKKLLPEVIEAVQRLVKEKEIPFILVSGRSPLGIFPVQEQLGIEGPVIAFGGGYVSDENRNKIYEKGLDKETALKIEEIVNTEKPDAALNFYNGLDWFTNDLSHPKEQWEAKSIGITPIEAKVEDAIKDGAVVNKLMFAGEETAIDDLNISLKERFPELHIVKSLPILLEVLNGNVQKSNGIELICQNLNLSPEEIVTIGDNYNDLDMLEMAGLPVVMANAPEEVKHIDKALIVTDNNSAGVAEAIEKIFFSE